MVRGASWDMIWLSGGDKGPQMMDQLQCPPPPAVDV